MNPERIPREDALQRIRTYQMNAFDGEMFVSDLIEYDHLWDEIWLNWDQEVVDVLKIRCPDWDSASRLLEITSYWPSDGIEAYQDSVGSWVVSGWWD
jgi:hypothetical protein